MSSLAFHQRSFVVVLLCLLGFFAAPVSAQEAIAPDDVVVAIGDVEYTAGDIDLLRKSLPANYRKSTALMDNGALVRVYAGLLAFAKKAEEEGLPDKEPFRTQLEFIRLDFFAQVYLRDLSQSITITEEEFQAYYEADRTQFEERSVSAIYIDYSLDPEKAPAVNGKPPLSENGARLKAKDLVAQLKAGADFAELAKQHSTDSTSAQKGGDLGSFKHDAKIPTPLKDVIFSLEPGAFSEARQHGGRFYIFHVTAVDAEPMQQVKNDSFKHDAKIPTPLAGKIQATYAPAWEDSGDENEGKGHRDPRGPQYRCSQRSLHEGQGRDPRGPCSQRAKVNRPLASENRSSRKTSPYRRPRIASSNCFSQQINRCGVNPLPPSCSVARRAASNAKLWYGLDLRPRSMTFDRRGSTRSSRLVVAQ